MKIGMDLSKSETMFVQCARLVPSKLPGIVANRSNQEIYDCDGAGLGDSGGTIVDIANGLGTVKALQKAGKVYLSVVMDAGVLAVAFKQLEEIIEAMSTMIPEIEKYLGAVTYTFTKGFTEFKTLQAFLHEQIVNLQNQSGKTRQFNAVREDMEIKTAPVQWKRAFLLQNLVRSWLDFDWLTGVSSPTVRPGDMLHYETNGAGIDDPANAFRIFLPRDGKVLFLDQLDDFCSVIRAMTQDLSSSTNLQTLVSRFDAMAQISKVLNGSEITDYEFRYKLEMEILVTNINNNFVALESKLRNAVLDDFELWDSDNFAEKKEQFVRINIQPYLDAIDMVNKLKKAFGESHPTFQTSLQVKTDYSTLIHSFETSVPLLTPLDGSLNCTGLQVLNYVRIHGALDRLQVLKEFIPGVTELYERACLQLASSKQNCQVQFQTDFSSGVLPVKNTVPYIDLFEAFSFHLRNHLQKTSIEEKQGFESSPKQLLLHLLEDRVLDTKKVLERNQVLSAEEWALVQSDISLFKDFRDTYTNMKHFSSEEMNQIRQAFLRELSNYVTSLNNLITKNIALATSQESSKEEKIKAINDLHAIYQQLKSFADNTIVKNLDSVGLEIQSIHTEVEFHLGNLLTTLVKGLESSLVLLESRQATSASNLQLSQGFYFFEDAKWIENFRLDEARDVTKSRQRIHTVLESFQREISDLELTAPSYASLFSIKTILKQVEYFSEDLLNHFPDLKKVCFTITSIAKNKRRDVVQGIEKFINQTISFPENNKAYVIAPGICINF